jgi:hypothetical protein
MKRPGRAEAVRIMIGRDVEAVRAAARSVVKIGNAEVQHA